MSEFTPQNREANTATDSEWDRLAEEANQQLEADVIDIGKGNIEGREGLYVEERLQELIRKETGKSPAEFIAEVEEDSREQEAA